MRHWEGFIDGWFAALLHLNNGPQRYRLQTMALMKQQTDETPGNEQVIDPANGDGVPVTDTAKAAY